MVQSPYKAGSGTASAMVFAVAIIATVRLQSSKRCEWQSVTEVVLSGGWIQRAGKIASCSIRCGKGEPPQFRKAMHVLLFRAYAFNAIPPPSATPMFPPNELTISDITAAIDRFLAGQIDAVQLMEWAERHECRDDVEYESERENAISRALFELATPEVNGELTEERVREI